MQHSILIVDDEKDILDALERQLRKDYKILKATSGIGALRILQKEKIHLILSDQRMPEMTGVQLFEKAQLVQPDAIRILLTGYTDVDSVIAAINNGQIYRYITKPWDPLELDVIVKRALESYDLRSELKEKNEKLETAYQELKTLDTAKSHFMILIGHELKTPLTTITSYLSLLKEEVKDKDLLKYIMRISQGTERLHEIVFDVLDLLAAETGQMTLKKKENSLKPLFDTLQHSFLESIQKKSLTIKTDLKSEKAVFDQMLLSKALTKVFHNAVKFADENSVINITSQVTERAKLEVKITNHGPALSEDQILHIMKPFNLDENILNHSQGMGLGLAVCQSLLKHHGSEIKIQSDKNSTSVAFLL